MDALSQVLAGESWDQKRRLPFVDCKHPLDTENTEMKWGRNCVGGRESGWKRPLLPAGQDLVSSTQP